MRERAFETSYDDATATLTLVGIVDELSLEDMSEAIRVASADHTRSVTIDLGGLDFLPSIGLGVLAVAMRKGRKLDAPVHLVTRRGSLSHRVLEVSGLQFELA